MDLSRNWLFIPDDLQKKIADCTLLICGTGMGSMVVEAAVRTGFKNIIFADGDTVEKSNLNRQNFTLMDLGKNKAAQIRDRILKIEPDLNIKVLEKFLVKEDLEELVQSADFVINSIDFDSPDFLHCHNICKKHNSVELFPINIGFGAALIVNDNKSPKWSEFFKGSDLKEAIIGHVFSRGEFSFQTHEHLAKYTKTPSDYDPQLCMATLACANLTISAIVQELNNNKVVRFPDVISYDPIVQFSGTDAYKKAA